MRAILNSASPCERRPNLPTQKMRAQIPPAEGERTASVVHPSQRFFGILVRKERWGLSWRGRLIVALVALATAFSVVSAVHPFLALTRRVDTNILVVEGWIQRYAMRAAVQEFRRGGYQRVFTTGGPENGSGGYVNDYQTSASVGADCLKAAGVPGELVQMVPSRVIARDRTYSSAVALREWLRQQNISVHGINVLTEDAHARRTRLLFQKAFGDGVRIGIISARNPDYDPKHWWRYSEGVREVVSEGTAYLYARIFFHPSAEEATRQSALPQQRP